MGLFGFGVFFFRIFQICFRTASFCGGSWQEGFDRMEWDSGHFAALLLSEGFWSPDIANLALRLNLVSLLFCNKMNLVGPEVSHLPSLPLVRSLSKSQKELMM